VILLNMTVAPLDTVTRENLVPQRTGTARHYLMCPPTYFEVVYSINPWMDPNVPVSAERAVEQWARLHDLYVSLGHTVEVMEPVPGLPDLVFAANGGIASGRRALAPRFANPERAPETGYFLAWFQSHGYPEAVVARHNNEGEGDVLTDGDRLLAGTGFRTDVSAHTEVADYFGHDVVSLLLVDPRYYHLDTALAVLAPGEIAYLPEAFAPTSRKVLERLYPDAIRVSAQDASVLGLNAVSDGANVAVAAAARGFAAELTARGFRPHPVDMSELAKAGGGAKCCTLELHA
jgi:N-dimethylarginine dimethylaminohydrolase